jgi:hypothetical protein
MFFFKFSVLAKFATWRSLLELELPHGHIEGLSVQLYGGKICSFFLVDKGNKMINSDLLFGVILSEICSYISSSLSFLFLLMSVILKLIYSNMLYGGIKP